MRSEQRWVAFGCCEHGRACGRSAYTAFFDCGFFNTGEALDPPDTKHGSSLGALSLGGSGTAQIPSMVRVWVLYIRGGAWDGPDTKHVSSLGGVNLAAPRDRPRTKHGPILGSLILGAPWTGEIKNLVRVLAL